MKMNGVRSMKTSFASPAPNTQHPAPTMVSIYLYTSLVIRAEDFLLETADYLECSISVTCEITHS